METALSVSSVIGSCCGCMVFVEYLAREDAGSMNLMTFSTFLFISVEGFINYFKFGKVSNKVPLRDYAELVVIFFLVSVVNNQALNFDVPVPLHIIFRSGSLVANMLMGLWILKQRYTPCKYFSVLLVTAGIIICTLATPPGKSTLSTDNESEFGWRFIIGFGMLWFTLLMSSLLGIRQEQLYRKHGKHDREALFYIHALSLPGFIFMASDIYKHVLIFNKSENVRPLANACFAERFVIPGFNFPVPRLWIFLILNDLAQYVCIRSVYKLTAQCTSLTVTLVLTLRKFLSLLISIAYFGNPFTMLHWVGTGLVFGGTILFTDPLIHFCATWTKSSKND